MKTRLRCDIAIWRLRRPPAVGLVTVPQYVTINEDVATANGLIAGVVLTDQVVDEYQFWGAYTASAGPLVKFPAKGSVTFMHDLGVAPDLVSTYVSFSELGTGESNLAENTGNQGEISCVDDKVVVVENGTCAQFYIRVVASRLTKTGEQSRETCVIP